MAPLLEANDAEMQSLITNADEPSVTYPSPQPSNINQ